ncbi:hypothetical protein PG996_013023 [Apiospora saccharicola]|uniref:Uncharacterized protein n=1 Tax=Apiospora saccharicola TaxID=335842 RepID=A0ABR1U4V2_9PEZI
MPTASTLPSLTRQSLAPAAESKRIAIFPFATLRFYLGSTKTERQNVKAAAPHPTRSPTPPAATGFACPAGYLVAIGSPFPTRNPSNITSGTWLANPPCIFHLSRTPHNFGYTHTAFTSCERIEPFPSTDAFRARRSTHPQSYI